MGLGKKEKFNENEARLIAGSASRYAIDKKIDNFSIECFQEQKRFCQAFGEGLVLGSYQFLSIKQKKIIINLFYKMSQSWDVMVITF